MEAILAVIRPKQNVQGHDYKAKLYDILLLDHKTVDRQGRPAKYLPTCTLMVEREPRDEILPQVCSMTGGDHVGIKPERALVIPWKDSHRSSLNGFTLFCIPVSHRDKLNASFADKSPLGIAFYPLDQLINTMHSSAPTLVPLTKTFVQHIEQWLKEKHSKQGALDYIFRSRAEFRVKMNVSNPVFLPYNMGLSNNQNKYLQNEYPEEIRSQTNEILAKMMAIEKCTKVAINPLFGSGLVGTGRRRHTYPPVDYPSGTLSRKSSLNSLIDPDRYSLEGRQNYPLHVFASKGDFQKVVDCVTQGQSPTQRDSYGWAPIHCAAYEGNHDIVKYLLLAGCSPNLVNADERTPLHLAANAGHLDVVNILLSHPHIDINVVDKRGQTALDTCNQKRQWEHIQVAKRIEMAMRKPKQIEVRVMDGTKKSLNLVDGANTTVHQLNQQMLREYDMPETPYADIFTIWICSESLELQLKPEHKPLEHMNSWKRKIVGNLTDGDPSTEEPHLKWRRNAKISLIVECEVTHRDAINLLFHEARYNYINAYYPCKEQDILQCASILLYLKYGGTADVSSAKSFLGKQSNLNKLVPMPNLNSRSNWTNKILHSYKEFVKSATGENSIRPQIQFLSICRKLTVYGSAFFTGNLQTSPKPKDSVKCLIAVNDVGIHIINYQTRQMLHTYKYSEISWQIPNEYGVLELTVVRPDTRSGNRHIPRNPLKLITKQAGMINPLMSKLSRMMAYNI
ncbi:krev interaction trapped protein 1-like [Dreissena polymorpha]|uniref:FERM domain-containing protein n=1 Tax=Dreissena polymorpha TaxID=45954 RepID=A0A9D4E8U1_DREPO|nr:krev interaction trapped protein 1-like [Dreissena polymorpha]KAH3774356.1 hypothetical protein DPMN_175737 [Dreissena polymorpha]